MQVLSQLDLLKERMELESAARADISSKSMPNSFNHEDEIEFPAFDKSEEVDQLPDVASKCIFDDEISWFPNATCVSIADEEIISDDDDRVVYPTTLRTRLYDGEGTSAGARPKAGGIVYSSDKPGVSSSKGGQVKHKNRLISPLMYTTKDSSLYFKGDNYNSKLFNVQPGNESNSATQKQMNKPMAELLEVYDVKLKQSRPHELENDSIAYQHSVEEFPDGFQEKSVFPLSHFSKHGRTKGRNRSVVHKRSKTSSCGREMYVNNETDSSDIGQSSGDEVFYIILSNIASNLYAYVYDRGSFLGLRGNVLFQDGPQNLKSTEAGKTMADQFQTIFGAMSTSDLPNRALPRQFGELHEKLQCMMQNEKEIEMIFLKRLSINDSSVGETQCMDVKILSRSLEARLNVCHCVLVGNKENFKTVNGCDMENFRRTLTIVFSTKICTDVELEVGNLIRIHSPWKEVQLKGNNEVVLLSTYFSLICC